MKKRLSKILALVVFTVSMPILTGCLTEIPFDVKSQSHNLVLSEKDSYKEIKVALPDEVRYASTNIENGSLTYQIENLSDKAANVTLYVGTQEGMSSSGENLLTKGIGVQGVESGVVTSANLISILNNENLYFGIKCEEEAVVAITFNFNITGSYNIVQGLMK